MLDSNLSIRQLSETTKEDFYKVHRAGEYTDFCLCGFWWVPSSEGWDNRTEIESIAQREELFSRGVSDGYLLYLGGQPIGWCQAYQRDLLPNLVRTFQLKPDPEIWTISCFMIVPSMRGKGYSGRFLEMVLADLKTRGVRKIQAFPKMKEGLSATDVWTGPRSIYEKAGFIPVEIHATRTVWQLDL